MNSWELMFLQSKVNNRGYTGDHLTPQNWAWPQETWFQKRLDELRQKRRQTAARPQQSRTQIFCVSEPV
jgi:hypothetical protein